MKKYLLYAAVIAIVGFLFYNKVYIPKHTYKTVTAKKADMAIKVSGVGNVGAKDIYKIGSIYGGKVLDFNINEGDFITKGTTVAKIDFVDLKDIIAEQEAMIKKLKNDIKSLQVDKQSALEKYNYQEEIYTKNKKLFKLKLISALEFKKYKTDYEVAKLLVDSLSSKIDSFKTQISQIIANIEGLKKRLSRYTIVAPIDGYITKKYISNYQIITPNQTLIEVVNPKDVWVKTFIDTRISGDVKVGDIAVIKLRSSNKLHKGKVVNIKPINNGITYEREIDVGFDNLPIPFYLEEQAIVDIAIKKLQNIVKIPTKVLVNYKNQDGVWVVENHKAKFKPIKILSHSDKFVGVDGLSLDDKILVPSPNKKALTDGMKIYHD